MRTPVKYLVVVGFVLSISVPFVASVAGLKPGNVENRAATAAPDLGGDALLKEKTYQALNRYLADRFALRGLAVRTNARLNDKIWKADSGDVRRGSDGWLFYHPSLRRLCTENLTVEGGLEVLDRFASQLDTSGRGFVYALAPEKSSVYPEYLADRSLDDGECAFEARDRLTEQLEARSFGVDLYGPLLERKAAQPEPIYHPRDTHWTMEGGAIYVERLIEALEPGLWNDAELVETGQQDIVPDLTRLLGLPQTEQETAFAVRRSGVETTENAPQPVEQVEFPIRNFTSTSSGAALVEGRTLLVYDSFTLPVIDLLAPFFADVTFVHWNALGIADVAALVEASDRVVIEGAEREFTWRMGEKLRPLSDELSDGLPPRRP